MRSDPAEIAALKKEVARLRSEHDILKKAAALLRAGGAMRFTFIAKRRHIWPVSRHSKQGYPSPIEFEARAMPVDLLSRKPAAGDPVAADLQGVPLGAKKDPAK